MDVRGIPALLATLAASVPLASAHAAWGHSVYTHLEAYQHHLLGNPEPQGKPPQSLYDSDRVRAFTGEFDAHGEFHPAKAQAADAAPRS